MEQVYSCGDCPVCKVLGDLMLLEAVQSRTLFLRCFRCEGAFESPMSRADELRPVEALAPQGFVLPGPERIREAIDGGWGATVMVSLDTDWKARLGPGLRAESAVEPPR